MDAKARSGMSGSPGWRRRAAASVAFVLTAFAATQVLCGSDLVAEARAAELRRFSVVIEHRKVVPDTPVLRATQGDTIEIAVTGDEPTELHLHGYDIALTLEPGKPTVFRFEAGIAGRFSMEAHGFGLPGAAGGTPRRREVTLLYLEIRPR